MKFKEWLSGEISRKYKNADKVIDMVKSGSSDLYNPAYNEKYREWIESKMPEPQVIELKKYNIEINDITIENWQEPSFISAGIGGAGSNLLYMLQNIKYKAHERAFQIPAMDFDKWEMSNLARIPFIPSKICKRKSSSEFGICSIAENECNVCEPVFIELYRDKIANTVPFGAMNLESRKILFDTKTPFITITHRDDEIVATLCTEPPTEIELNRETYGIIDIDFLLPAIHLASFKLLDIMKSYTEDNWFTPYINDIIKYNKDVQYIKQIFLDNSNDYAYGNVFYNYNQEWLQSLKDAGEKYDIPAKDCHRRTFYNVNKMFNSKDGIDEMFRLSKLKQRILDNVDFDYIYENIPNYESLVNRELFKITEDDVKKFLSDFKNN